MNAAASEVKSTGIGSLIDLADQIQTDPKKVVPGARPPMKVYPPPPPGAKGPMGITLKDQATSEKRVEYTKG